MIRDMQTPPTNTPAVERGQARRFVLWFAGLALLVLCIWAATVTHTHSADGPTELRVAVPAYFDPEGSDDLGPFWPSLLRSAPVVGLAVINPNDGPGDAPDPGYQSLVRAAQARGISILGYVYTQYGERKESEVRGEIGRYYSWYAVNGIFLDEASNDCAKVSYYQSLYTWIKETYGVTQTVALNPGTRTRECYISAGDILLTFEEPCDGDTSSNNCRNYSNWQPAGWETKYSADRFWHLVYDVPPAYLENVLAKARLSHVGWVYVTSDGGGNPWDTLPEYWERALELLGLRRVFLPAIYCRN